jgi:hypothetical protein
MSKLAAVAAGIAAAAAAGPARTTLGTATADTDIMATGIMVGVAAAPIADRAKGAENRIEALVPEEWLLARDQTFRAFLDGPMRNFFLGQILVEAGKPWPFGERPHSAAYRTASF